MNPLAANQRPESSARRDQLFSALVACTHCGTRRLLSIRQGEMLLLQRDGSLLSECSECLAAKVHRLVRIQR